MNKVLEYFKENDSKEVIVKNIRVYGWQNEYDHLIISSVSKYLFEELEIKENIAPFNDDNRPGTIKPKKYVTVHDTGDASPLHTAKFWSEAVYNQSWEQSIGDVVKYLCSYQYVVDNEGIYHNIPDNEVAYHAGDGTKFDYVLYKSGVKDDGKKAVVTISEDGYYMINGEKSTILAPRYHVEKNGVVIEDRIAKTEDINSQGVLCKVIDGEYCLGETYFSSGYRKIANRGGNNNSIGIESCITENTDIYYTWQRTAKLVARLLDENKLTLDDVKQHHYFSGKNCPQTIRMNGMWDHFMELVAFELQMIEFKKEGYKIELVVDDKRVNKVGRIVDNTVLEPISFKIRTHKDGIVQELSQNIEFSK
ncbi:MAG: N-acetylmuramoyl-L-alanine amidase [Bacilli bacterium]|nr:N-acetylmuramoyl-L-alanine amidase [Bacilli bacterium]